MTAPTATHRIAALIRLDLLTGVLLSLRAAVPLAAAAVAVAGTQSDPGAFFAGLARGVAAHPVDPLFAAGEALLAIALAAWASPRLAAGRRGWLRHLPASERDHRAAILLGLCASQGMLLAAGMLIFLVRILSTGALSWGRLAGLPLLAAGAACCAVPVKRRALSAPLGMLAALGGAMGGERLGPGLIALCLALMVGGPLHLPAPRPAAGPSPGAATAVRLASRALGWRRAGPCLLAAVPLAGGVLLIANNRLSGEAASRSIRLAGGLCVTVLLAGLAEIVASRRPDWPWSRSLPWSSAHRTRADALLMGGHALPFLLAACLFDWRAALTVACVMPLLAARASGLLRTIRSVGWERRGPPLRVLVEGFVLTGTISLLPWLAPAALAASPLALRDAAHKDREAAGT